MSLRRVFESQPDRRYIMFGGKGGLGKTTLSATSAFWLARQGKRVLLFSVDPQASLSDIFQRDIFGQGPVPIVENLWAQEVDADRRIKDYQEEIRKKILDMYGFVVVPEEMIILDTKKAAALFAKFDVPLSGYIVNRILPADLGPGTIPPYLQNRIAMQKKYLDDIKGAFGNEVLAYVPEMERDVTGLAMIERLARRLFDEG